MLRARATHPQLQCCVCIEDVTDGNRCTCCGEAPGHFSCNECFSNMVVSQATGEGKPVFLTTGCKVTCSFCLADGVRSVFDMRICAPHLTPAAYSAYHKSMAEPEVLREQLQWQQRMQRQEAEFTAHVQHVQRVAAAASLDPHLKHIAEELILPRCPKQSCRRHIAAFEACGELQVTPSAACMCFNAASPAQPYCCSAAASMVGLSRQAGLRCSSLCLVLTCLPRRKQMSRTC
jgi:hypothetical protein